MKFLCPSCKAKYQIADEKVAGRSVRMKCRKCGFMIQVSSALAAPPGDSDPPDAGDIGSSAPPAADSSVLPPVAPAPAAPVVAPTPSPVAPPVASPAAPAAASPAAPAAKAALGRAPAPKVAPAPAAPAARSPAKPSIGSTLPKPATPPRASVPKASSPLAPSKAAPVAAAPSPAPAPVAAPPPKAAAPVPAAVPAPAAVAVKELPRDFESDDEVTRMADAGALAGAFSQAFGGGNVSEPPAAETPLSMPGDEWFVGINGVPVGPIRLSELRSKAASGAVNKESLVWRDGFEDWRPLKTYPELVAIVEEGVSSARASLTPFMPPVSEGQDSAKPGTVAAFAEQPAPSPGAVTGSAVVTDDISALLPPRRGTSPMVWVAMVIAIAFGLTLGFVFFGGQKPGEKTVVVEKIVEKEVPAKDTGSPAAANNGTGETITADPAATARRPGTSGRPAATSKEQETAARPNTGLSGLNGLSNLGPSSGPATGGPSGATGGGGGQLDGGQIQSTVARYTGSVKRRCWQPALDARARDAPMTAKVTVTITVGGTGSVQNATTTGDPKGYTGLANCIASSVRSWQFPAAGGQTIANVPFVFAGQ